MPIRFIILLLMLSISGWCAELYNPLFSYVPNTAYSVILKPLGVGGQCMYTGTFKFFQNKITGKSFYIPDKGVYTDSRGFKYTGTFDYLPLRYDQGGIKNGVSVSMSGGGVFIFAGERQDELLGDDQTTGIFISSMESPLMEYAFDLAEATPDYMTKLYERSTNDIAYSSSAAQDVAQRSQKFGILLNVLSGVLSIAGGNVNGLSGFSNIAGGGSMSSKAFIAQETLTIVKKTMSGEEDFTTAMKSAAGDSIKQVVKKYGGKNTSTLMDAITTLSGT